MDAEVRELEKARILPFDISGTFAGRGLSQRLIIDSKADGKLYIIFAGSSAASGPLRLAWLNEKKVKMCVPPHLSPDLLGNGDWAELTFEVHIEGNTVTTLSRETGTETDYFDRTVDVP